MSERLEELRAALKGRYEIERELGHGGMATVYLAQDVERQREVAVKVLRPDLAAALGPDRFLREIRIAANLTHPHILPLYDSGDADGFLFYVMPYIEGQTLRDRIDKEGELPIAETVRVIREVVDALAFAHSKGVVHRDIKPDNVMLTGGHAIVADFGVAKAVSEATGRDKLTTAGVALGTPAYMSPEQATADPHVDHRADIYAVGAMAYELLAGRTPFTGATPQSILAAHVTEQVDPVSKYRDHVSAELEALIMRCLEKKPADRWQSADEMLPHLESMATSSGGLTPTATVPLTGVTAPRKGLNPLVVAGVALLAAIGVFGSKLFRPEPFVITVSNERPVTTDIGLEFEPSLSPDGERVVYLKGGPFKTHPYVEVLGGEVSSRLGASLPGYQRTPVWTADGNNVTFGQRDQPGDVSTRKSTSMLGGVVTALDVPRIRSYYMAWSPDDSLIVYFEVEERIGRVYVRAAAGGEAELIVDGLFKDAHSFAWSPDGRRIAYVLDNSEWLYDEMLGNVRGSQIMVVDVEGGELVEVTEIDGVNVSPQWLPDGLHLLFVSNRDVRRGIYVAEVGSDAVVGVIQRLSGGSNPHSISISADGGRLAYSNFNYARNVFAYAIPETGIIKLRDGDRITSGTEVIEQFSVSPDGEWLSFDSNVNGNQDIFKMRMDGSERTQLTSDPGDDFLTVGWSPDGTELAFDRVSDGVRVMQIIMADGSGEFISVGGDWSWSGPLFWSSTGLELWFGGRKAGTDRSEVWITSRNRVGGEWSEPVQMHYSGCSDQADLSPDGSKVVCEGDGIKLFSRGGELLWHLGTDLEAGGLVMRNPKFSGDGATVYAVGLDAEGSQGIWATPTEGGTPRLVIESDDESRWILDYSLRVHGDRIYLSIAEYESDIWVMDLEWE